MECLGYGPLALTRPTPLLHSVYIGIMLRMLIASWEFSAFIDACNDFANDRISQVQIREDSKSSDDEKAGDEKDEGKDSEAK